VEKPLQLAEYILKNHSKWNIDFLKIEIGQTVTDKTKISEYNKLRSELRKNSSYGKTTELKLEKKIPLFIDYYTAWVDKEGRLNFREDVYKKDKILSDYLTLNKNI
jgi:murein L,D-transpeptidase YcbB/YkuD